jgi:ribonuclease HI
MGEALVDLKRSAALLAALAAGEPLAAAADAADLDHDQAVAILQDLAERLRGEEKKLAKIDAHEQAQRQRAEERTGGVPDKLVIAFDGGSRGNPGPSAGGAVAIDEHNLVIAEKGIFLNKATNNVAEYNGLLVALELADSLGVRNVRLQSDSELVVKQMRGEYKVKNKALIDLFIEANRRIRGFDSWKIRHVRREQNTAADAFVNEILNEKAPKKKPGKEPTRD